MGDIRITVNGQHYGSAEEMPPEVRRQYEEAMQRMGRALAGIESGTTQVVTHSGGAGLQVTQTTRRTYVHVDPSQPGALPIQPSNAPSEGRRFVYDVAFWVIVALALWFWLGRY
jgi:hypothetical protein